MLFIGIGARIVRCIGTKIVRCIREREREVLFIGIQFNKVDQDTKRWRASERKPAKY
jgi:hypothetical protein